MCGTQKKGFVCSCGHLGFTYSSTLFNGCVLYAADSNLLTSSESTNSGIASANEIASRAALLELAPNKTNANPGAIQIRRGLQYTGCTENRIVVGFLRILC